MDGRRGDDRNNALLLAAAGAGAFLLGRSLVRHHRWYDLEGKTVIVTGGSRGFGLLMAREFSAQGANLVICARDEAELERAPRGQGRIVNVSSIGGKLPAPHLLPYTASKYALVGFSEGLRAELKKDNIYVTTVCPGLIRTGSPRNAFFKGQNRAEYAWFSVSDSLPLTSMSARRGARRVVLACQRGESEVILSIQAKLAARFHGLFPGITSDLFSLVNGMLPGPGGIGERRARGYESESTVSESFVTALSRRAAEENNEMATRTEPRI